MALVLTEEQILVQDTARDFCASRAPVAQLRALRDTNSEPGFDPEVWTAMAALGWPGIAVAEEWGGSAFGFAGLGVILEQCGRTLAASPLFATAVLGGSALQLGGTPAQRDEHLPPLAAGETRWTLAADEGPRHAPGSIATQARPREGGFRLDGVKTATIDGHVADRILVAAALDGGIGLFVVPAGTPGLRVERLRTVDSRNAARVHLDGVEVPTEARLGGPEADPALLERVLDRARIGTAAEMLGLAQECFDRTLAYLKERRQFGVPIGSFQALKHRMADLFAELELARSVVFDALSAVDDGDDRAIARAASLAKARMGEVLNRASNEAIQMHGGIGMTDEFDIGFYVKRARVLEHAFGTATFHRDRFAALEGF